jgi:hypothetical protein
LMSLGCRLAQYNKKEHIVNTAFIGDLIMFPSKVTLFVIAHRRTLRLIYACFSKYVLHDNISS